MFGSIDSPSLLLLVAAASILTLHAEVHLELLIDGDAVVQGAPALTVVHCHEVVLVS